MHNHRINSYELSFKASCIALSDQKISEKLLDPRHGQTQTARSGPRMTRRIARYGTTLGRHVLHVCTVHAVSSKLFTQLFELVCQLIAVRQKRWAAPGLRGTSLQRAGPFGPKTELVLGQPSHVGHRSHARLGWPSEIWDILPQGGMIGTWDDPVESGTTQPNWDNPQPLTGTPG